MNHVQDADVLLSVEESAGNLAAGEGKLFLYLCTNNNML